jgi:hypothetical protein
MTSLSRTRVPPREASDQNGFEIEGGSSKSRRGFTVLRARFPSMPLRLPVLAPAAVLALGALGVLGAGAGSAACTTDTAIVGVTPVTGVLVRSNALVTGIGCGTGDAQIFEYVAVVTSQDDPDVAAPELPPDGKSIWSGTYPCYADAVFVNLPFSQSTATTTFDVKVFGYSKAAFDASTVEATASGIGGTVNEATRTNITALRTASTWTTDCKATQQPNVEVLADCAPLVASVTTAP